MALTAYAVLLHGRTTATAGGSDSSGYLNSAKLLAGGRLQADLRIPLELQADPELPVWHFTPLGFVPSNNPTRLTPTYPTGLPLHFALAGRLLGWASGPRLVLLAAALAAVWLTYLAGRELGISYPLAAAGAAMVAVFPVFLFTSIQALSDTLATAWSIAALYGAMRARMSRIWAAACGAAFSISVLVRPTNVVLAPALLVLIGWDWRRLLALTLSGLPAACWLLFYNSSQYGGPLQSGYGPVSALFALEWGWPTFLHFAKWLGRFLPAVLLVLPVVAVFHARRGRREALALLLAFSAISGLYLFYSVSHEVWWCLRFILPAVPPLILAAMLGVESLAWGLGSRWQRRFRPAAALGLAAWAGINSWYWSNHLHVFVVEQQEQTYEDVALVARARLPEDALVCTLHFSGTLYYYTHFAILRFDLIQPGQFALYVERLRTAGRPIIAMVFDWQTEELNARCPGEWTLIDRLANVGFWRLE